MAWQDLGVRAPFVHRSRVLGDAEAQQASFVPDLDRFDKWAGGELAVADGAHAAALDARTFGISESRTEEPFARLRQIREGEHVLPDHFGRRRDGQRGAHLEYRRLRR